MNGVLEHLEALRRMFFKIFAVFALFCIPGWVFSGRMVDALLKFTAPEGFKLHYFSLMEPFFVRLEVMMVAAAVIVTILDYIAPVWFTKKSGGSKYGAWGATIGLFIGMFAGFPGIILGPFIGAYIGELIAETPSSKAFKVACMSFVAFMLTSGIKLIFSIYILVTVISEGWSILF